MKRTFTLLFLTLCALATQAQITLTTTDMPLVGWTNVMQKDTLTGAVNWGNRGANQVYDFTFLHNDKPDTLFYLTPTPSQTSAVPNAQIAITGDHNTYIFSKNNPTNYDYVGGQIVYNGTTILTPFNPIDTGYKFTTAYNQHYAGTYGYTTTQPGSAFGQPTVYQVRITNTTTYTDSIDGWGMVKTPIGTYNCLRQHRLEHSSTLLEYKLFSFSPWANVPTGAGLPNNPIVAVNNTYNYLAKETHGTVISFTYDSVGNPLTASWSKTPPVPVANFNYVLGASGSVTFTDSSVTAPLTYSWNFGDGTAASTAASPSHTFTANGTYYVCETVTNASGSNTFCDSVHITNIVVATIPPTAGNDVATVTQPGTVNIPALANDVNHNAGDTLCINTIFGVQAGWATLSGCSTIVFHPLNANYTGLDTFYYKVCDIHVPTLCDTAMVVVTVLPAPVAPTANNDTASVVQPGTINISAAANDVSHNAGHTLCITAAWGTPAGWATVASCSSISFHPLNSNFTGLDTFYYKICDQQLPTLCDTGMVVVNVLPPASVAPTANNDTASVVQPGTVNISPAANDVNHNAGHTMCITAAWGTPAGWATVQSCSSVAFHPLNPNFVGLDTFYYKVCDQQLPTLCDTGMVVVNVVAGVQLPVIAFSVTPHNCGFSIVDSTTHADSTHYHITASSPAFDTVIANLHTYTHAAGQANIIVCVTAYNTAGNAGKCDTVSVVCTGLNEITQSDFRIYPNPAVDRIELDLSHIDQATMADIAAIEVYNVLGEKLKTITAGKSTTINVSDLSNGVYLIALMDKNHTRKVLGKFEVLK